MKKKLIIILFFSFFVFVSLSQPFLDWENYTYNQNVTGIEIQGNNLWISTNGGLVKYNKKTDEKIFYNRANLNLPDNNLMGVCYCKDSSVWITTTNNGIGKLKNNTCTWYSTSNSGLPYDLQNRNIKTDGIGNIWMESFRWMVKFDDKSWKTWETGSPFSSFPVLSGFDIDTTGVVWVYSTDGLGKIENNEYSVISTVGSSLNKKTGCVKVDNNQNVWFAIEGEGLYKYDGHEFTHYPDTLSGLKGNIIYDITVDPQNRIWLAGSNNLIQFSASSCIVYPAPEYLFSVKADKGDTIWCGTFRGDLLCFDGKKYNYIDISASPLTDNIVTKLFIDTGNNKWISTRKNTYLKTEKRFNEVYNKSAAAMVSDNDGATWVAFNTGDTCLLKIEKTNTIVYTKYNSPFKANIQINSMAMNKNNELWISSNNGIYIFDGRAFTNYSTTNSSIPSNYIGLIIFDHNDNLWGALNEPSSSNGLCRYDGSTWTVWNTSNSKIPTNVVIGMDFDSENKIWFSCMDKNRKVGGKEDGGGLTCFDGNTMKTFNINNSGLLCNTIFDVFVDGKDKIWMATSSAGLMNYDKKDKWNAFNVSNSGIAHNWVQQIKQDLDGNLWLGHPGAGVSVYSMDSLTSYNYIEQNSPSFQIYPNPVSDFLMVKYSNISKEEIIFEIFDINGNLIKRWPLQMIIPKDSYTKLKVQDLLNENQVYILRVSSNKKQACQKFLYIKK